MKHVIIWDYRERERMGIIKVFVAGNHVSYNKVDIIKVNAGQPNGGGE